MGVVQKLSAFWNGPPGWDHDPADSGCDALVDRAGRDSAGVSPYPKSGLRLKETFLVTGSQDCTVKLWPIPEALLSKGASSDSGPVLPQAQATQRCHDKVTARGTSGHGYDRALAGMGV